jgi:lysine/ornithine N-monooxygenase
MKNILESPEIFHAYAQIDWAYWQIEKVQEAWNAAKPKSPIEAAVYDATGYGEAKDKEFTTQIMELLTVIIENKKIVGADYASAETFKAQTEAFLAGMDTAKKGK